MISSIYDPLGFIAPLILPAKLPLQDLCRMTRDWDNPIPSAFQERWNKRLMDLEKVADFIHFSDARESSYGTATYLRMQNVKEMVHVAFLFGKAKLAPLKAVIIPSSELTAAVVAVRMDRMLQSELQLPLKKACFWTGSTSEIRTRGFKPLLQTE